MADDTSAFLDFSAASLLITAHGSPSTTGGRTSSRKHAQTIKNLRVFEDVQAGFLTEKPFVDGVLDSMTSPEVYVLPNLVCAGYISTHKLPQALGLTGDVTERIGPNGHQRIILCKPVGTDPGVVKVFASRILTTMRALQIEQDDCAIIVIGHGSQKSRASFNSTTQLSQDIAKHGIMAPIQTAFLEEPTLIADWRQLTDAKTVVFAPYLISDGYHGSDEIPRDIGFDPKSTEFQERLEQVLPNEVEVDGRRLVYLPPLGDAPEMAELMLNRVRTAQSTLAAR
ncbi:MAG: hypothetical protein OQK24_13945 [Magnetovibrio sp.]|nr:hypothetical protein [Magnetovibrio sp.]